MAGRSIENVGCEVFFFFLNVKMNKIVHRLPRFRLLMVLCDQRCTVTAESTLDLKTLIGKTKMNKLLNDSVQTLIPSCN